MADSYEFKGIRDSAITFGDHNVVAAGRGSAELRSDLAAIEGLLEQILTEARNVPDRHELERSAQDLRDEVAAQPRSRERLLAAWGSLVAAAGDIGAIAAALDALRKLMNF